MVLDVADWVVEDVPEVEELVSVVTWGVQSPKPQTPKPPNPYTLNPKSSFHRFQEKESYKALRVGLYVVL